MDTEGIYLNIIKDIYNKTATNIILNCEKLKTKRIDTPVIKKNGTIGSNAKIANVNAVAFLFLFLL